jgi:hypothetical protein
MRAPSGGLPIDSISRLRRCPNHPVAPRQRTRSVPTCVTEAVAPHQEPSSTSDVSAVPRSGARGNPCQLALRPGRCSVVTQRLCGAEGRFAAARFAREGGSCATLTADKGRFGHFDAHAAAFEAGSTRASPIASRPTCGHSGFVTATSRRSALRTTPSTRYSPSLARPARCRTVPRSLSR